ATTNWTLMMTTPINSLSKLDTKISLQTQWFSKKLITILDKYLTTYPKKIQKIIHYSLFPGGKRIRPLLMFATGEMLNVDIQKLLYPACSIELIHNYSLIHDDLPSMDNDDYRRGKLTVHKKFGEANAILTGDGLLTLAFELLADWKIETDVIIKVLKLVSSSAGFSGLVKGQMMDLDTRKMINHKNKRLIKSYLRNLTLDKTAKLIQICITIPAIVKNIQSDMLKIISDIGTKIGLLFQITDDLIDYNSGQDVENLSYPIIYGKYETQKILENLYKEIINKIQRYFFKNKHEYLSYLIYKIATRKH
ncbi:MAG: polyprenyl synthetase family protein, partial [Endomicrobia bacterium]|nr:polyprenyl synthetase family protein [Endomicrobiia bacterium]